jgi:hypothetical protein
MTGRRQRENILSPEAQHLYHEVLGHLLDAGVPFLVGGAYAFRHYTGIARHTKDFDIFVRERDRTIALHVLAAQGYASEITSPIWLAKAFCGEHFIDIIYGSANGVAPVDDLWFERAPPAKILGHRVRLVPPEEMIWQKSFIMERERYDGADIAHVLLKQGPNLDWHHLLDRFGGNWRLLLSHLILFEFVYPDARGCIPDWVMHELLQRRQGRRPTATDEARLCRGTLISGQQYRVDVESWGFEDARALVGGETADQQEQRRASDRRHHLMAP